MDPRPSRQDKLLSIPPDHLLLMAFRWICDLEQSTAYAVKLLESASIRGHKESDWLLEKVRTIPPKAESKTAKRLWLDKVMKNEDNPWANFYRGFIATLFGGNRDLLKRSSDAGFTRAMAHMADHAWILKSAELNDPHGLFLRYRWIDHNVDTLLRAANLGSLESMARLIDDHYDQISTEDFSIFTGRYLLGTGYHRKLHHSDPYLIGRELEGYEQFWDPVYYPNNEYQDCIQLYLDTIHLARRAALQMTFGLRPILGRDVAQMIGKMVYEMRTDWQANKKIKRIKVF